MNAPSQPESRALTAIPHQEFSLQPRSFDEAWNLATMIANTDMAPKDYQGKAERCMVAIQWGDEVGLKPLQSVQNIAVINGRPSLWGDSMLAIVRASPLCEYFIEKWEGSGDALKAICRTKRRGEPEEQIREFTMDDARKADLLGKDTYKKFGKRMLQMRARAWLIRDVYTDLIRGLHMAEEAMDMPPAERFMGPADVVPPTAAAAAPATYPQDLFEKNFPSWEKVIQGKKKTVDEVIATVETKAPLTEEQKGKLRALAPAQQAQDVTPKTTFAQVAERINKAENRDQLDEAALLIGEVGDEQQRRELTASYETRLAEMKD